MSLEVRLMRAIIAWLNRRYPFLVREVVIPSGAHVHLNPKKKVKATMVVNFPGGDSCTEQ